MRLLQKDEISNKSNSLATIQWQVAVSASNFYDSTSTKKATMMTRKNLTHSKIEIVSIQAQKKTEVEGRMKKELKSNSRERHLFLLTSSLLLKM